MAFDISKLKNLFVETSTESKNFESNSNSNDLVVESSNKSTSEVKVDKTIIESLYKSLTDNNLPGEDYVEFADALKAMQNIPLEDAMKVQTVMATLSTKGLTVAKIKESAEHYKKVLSAEQDQFSKELKAQIDKSVNSKKQTLQSLKEKVKDKTEQIAKLTNEITECQQNIIATEELIRVSEMKIETAQENFNVAYNFVIKQINDNLSKL